MSDRFHSFTVEKLHALVFRLDVAETVETLDEVAAELREEMIRELTERKGDLRRSSLSQYEWLILQFSDLSLNIAARCDPMKLE